MGTIVTEFDRGIAGAKSSYRLTELFTVAEEAFSSHDFEMILSKSCFGIEVSHL